MSGNGMVRLCSRPASDRRLQGAPKTGSTSCLRWVIQRHPEVCGRCPFLHPIADSERGAFMSTRCEADFGAPWRCAGGDTGGQVAMVLGTMMVASDQCGLRTNGFPLSLAVAKLGQDLADFMPDNRYAPLVDVKAKKAREYISGNGKPRACEGIFSTPKAPPARLASRPFMPCLTRRTCRVAVLKSICSQRRSVSWEPRRPWRHATQDHGRAGPPGLIRPPSEGRPRATRLPRLGT